MLQKKYEDYAKRLYEKFPLIEEKTLDVIADFGLKKLYSYVRNGGDMFLKDREFYLFIGSSLPPSKEQYIKSKFKQHGKIRRLFKDSKVPWNRWHYFGLTELENKEFVENGFLPIITLYKLRKECSIRRDIKYVYKTNLEYTLPEKEIRWLEKRENIKIENCEYSEE